MPAVSVLLNRDGGALAADDTLADKVGDALKAAGLDVEVELIAGGDCAVRARAVAERGDPLLIVGGGDGTISAAASALAGTETSLGILPLGTLNHFARDLGIPTDLDEAARLIAAGKDRRVDIGEMNDRIFINNSAIGLYPLMVVDRDGSRSGSAEASGWRCGRLAAHADALQSPAADADGERGADRRVDTPLLFVGNNDYRIDIGAPGQRERLDDGRAVRAGHAQEDPARLPRREPARTRRSEPRRDDMVRLEGVERLRVSAPRARLAVSLDGEVVRAAPPLDYRIRKKALRVIAP